MLSGPLRSISEAGKPNLRSVAQVGRSWEERFFFKVDENGREFLAQINDYWRNATELDVQHQAYLTTLGVGTGTPLIKGASQTGSTINTDGWTISQTGILKAGDLVKFAAIDTVYEITADCDSDGAGDATLPINPPVFSGGSPGDNTAVTVTASVLFKAYIFDLQIPAHGPDDWVSVRLSFQESP
jgi:hypothetical protein